MSKKELRSADARKSRQDPNQQQKSGAAKPTYVATDKKKKVKEEVDVTAVAKELDKASKMHKGQANKLRKHADEMKEEKKPKNCGCGQDPCITYGKKKEKVDEACWKGYKAYGVKKKAGKVVPNCKPVGSVKKEEVIVTESDKKGKGSGKKDACYHKVKASAKVWPSAYASGRLVQCRKKGAANYGNSKKESFSWRDELDFVKEGAAWTKKSGKNPKGGLNEKGRKSYEAENPGSDLKAPSKKPGNKRRASFCARMKGMKKKLTSAKTARDPDSRINKSLRAWNCGYEPDGTPIMEKDAALDFVRNKYKGQIYDPKKVKKPSEADKAKASAERKKRQDADNKAYASRAKKAGFKSTQDYTNVVARYGSEDNYRKGKGLGT